MRRLLSTMLLIAALAAPCAARAQVLAAGVGAATGLAGGVIVTVGWIVEQATFEDQYLHDIDDLISFTGSPILIGPAIGVGLAFLDEDVFWESQAGGAAGMLVGTALGVGVGHLLVDGRRGRWAGGTMGAALGLLAGAGYVVATSWDRLAGEESAGVPVAMRIPLP